MKECFERGYKLLSNRIIPQTKGFNEFIFRTPISFDEIEIIIGKSSYNLSLEDAKIWFQRIYADPEFTRRMFDYLYNFRCLKFIVSDLRFIPFEWED